MHASRNGPACRETGGALRSCRRAPRRFRQLRTLQRECKDEDPFALGGAESFGLERSMDAFHYAAAASLFVCDSCVRVRKPQSDHAVHQRSAAFDARTPRDRPTRRRRKRLGSLATARPGRLLTCQRRCRSALTNSASSATVLHSTHSVKCAAALPASRCDMDPRLYAAKRDTVQKQC